MNAKNRQTVGIIFVAALVAVLIGLIPTCSQAAEPATIENWNRLNDSCRGAQIVPEQNPVCKARDRMTTRLMQQSYVLENHDVWVSQAQFRAFGETLRSYDEQVRSGAGDLMSIMPAMMRAMLARIPLEQLFAIWNDPDMRGLARDMSPAGWAMMSEGMRQLAMYHFRENNPALTLAY